MKSILFNKMKALIIIFCVVVANVQAADIIQEIIGQSMTECKNQVQATSEDMMILLQHQPTATKPAKCFLACIAKKYKFMNADGELNFQVIRDSEKYAKLIGEDIYKKLSAIVEKCLSKVHVGDNECEVAYSYFTCGVNEAIAANLPNILLGVLF